MTVRRWPTAGVAVPLVVVVALVALVAGCGSPPHARVAASVDRTQTIEVTGRQIDILDGVAYSELVRWAMSRFKAAGLAAPRVESVAFGASAAKECTGANLPWAVEPGQVEGLAVDLHTTEQVYVCLPRAAICADHTCARYTPRARLLVLHELGHAWADRNATSAAKRAFLDAMDLDTWDAPRAEWGTTGIEQVAQVVGWGLMDEAMPVLPGARRCAQVLRAFRAVTGTAPLQTRCP